MRAVEASARVWLSAGIPAVYRTGAQVAGRFAWNTVHRHAVEQFAADTFAEIRVATAGVRSDARRFARQAARAAVRQTLTEGETAHQAARQYAKRLRDVKQITAVRYADGTRRTIGDYGDMLVRTKSATAHNFGTINQSAQEGIEYIELLDNPDCGLTSHDDTQKANGLIVTLAEANQYPISHPRAMMGGQRFLPIGHATEAVRARYRGPAITVTTLQDNDLTVSPHHPVLTLDGWRPAHTLRPGDHVGSHNRSVHVPTVAASDFDEMPFVEDAFAALVELGSFASGVPAPHDLHGDAQFCDPEVDVVRVDSALLGHLPSCGLEFSREPLLVGAGVQAETLGVWHGVVAPVDLEGIDWVPVARVEESAFDGFVYDFTTTGHAYAVSGWKIILANCVRALAPRPDMTAAEVGSYQPSTTPEQDADQAQVAAEREARSARRQERKARQARTARTARTARAGR